MKVSALSAAAVPTGSRGADRYQGGMLMPSAPAPNAHRPIRRLRSGASKNSSFFCTFSQPFHGIFESSVAVFNSLFIKDNQAKLRKMPSIISLWKVKNIFFEILCAFGGGRADGLPWRGLVSRRNAYAFRPRAKCPSSRPPPTLRVFQKQLFLLYFLTTVSGHF